MTENLLWLGQVLRIIAMDCVKLTVHHGPYENQVVPERG